MLHAEDMQNLSKVFTHGFLTYPEWSSYEETVFWHTLLFCLSNNTYKSLSHVTLEIVIVLRSSQATEPTHSPEYAY